ncbi:hypothetical protein HAX54_020582 [Datura stramonium]|uniref:RNase H type-1 domain-containing protein n=1 Tax=Datura stramonium TaxID=4076 RepID=A0ABS8URB6_DATST|nr:hypothetical protein [Datura stramonium]
MAELVAVKYGVEMCKVMGINNIDIEVDSAIVANMLYKGGSSNLHLKSKVEEIRTNISSMNTTIKHCYGEPNQVADGLAKYASSHNVDLHFNSFQDLPKEIKGAYQLDKHHMRNLRIRYDKANLAVRFGHEMKLEPSKVVHNTTSLKLLQKVGGHVSTYHMSAGGLEEGFWE